MNVKQHVLLVISDKAIELPKNLDGVKHLINKEVELKHEPDQKIDFIIDDDFEGVGGNGVGIHISQAITSWLRSLVSDMVYQPFYQKLRMGPGTEVKTIRPNGGLHSKWTDEVRANRKWGVDGKVIARHDSDGVYYDVEHVDGTVGSYDPSELRFTY